MANITDIPTNKTKLKRLLESASPKNGHKPHPKNDQSGVVYAAPAFIVCTMIPIPKTAIFFSMCAVIVIAIIAAAWAQDAIRVTKRTWTLIIGLSLVSVVSGCSPLLTDNFPKEFIDLNGKATKIHTLQRVGFLGLGLDDITIDTARKEAHLKSVVAVKEVRGYGLISVARITVAGKS